jgi:hypothetical protein
MPGEYSQEALRRHFDQTNERLAAIEAQLKVLSEKAGVSYEEPLDQIPEDVLQMARDGKKLEAAQRYRELTGVDAKDALAIISRV